MPDGFPCMNCRQPVNPNAAKVFAEVFVCDTCYLTAERLYVRSERELKGLLSMLKEGIRIALVEGRLHFTQGRDEELPKEELLKAIVELQAMKDARKLETPK